MYSPVLSKEGISGKSDTEELLKENDAAMEEGHKSRQGTLVILDDDMINNDEVLGN